MAGGSGIATARWTVAVARAILRAAVPALVLPLLSACGPRAADAPSAEAAETEAIAVRLVRVNAGGAGAERVATGTVRLRRETPLAFVEAGRIASLGVREGDEVVAGARLAVLDRVAIDSAVAAAEAERSRAAAELQRQQRLKEKGWVAQARVDAAAASARAAEAEVAARRFAQQFAEIRAPSAGIILQRLAEPGETLAAGTPVLVLGERRYGHVLRVGVSAADVSGLAVGQVADILFRDGAAAGMRGTVIEIAARADQRTGTFQVEFALPEGAQLRSGMIAEARWRAVGGFADPLRVPATALFSARAGEGFVWRFDPSSGRVTAALVALGPTDDRGTVIRSGIAAGDRIVVAGVDRLIEGQRVKAVAGG